MTTKKFSAALGSINESYIDEAVAYTTTANKTVKKVNDTGNQKKMFTYKQVSVLVASLCLVFIICFSIPLIMQTLHGSLPDDTADDTQENDVNNESNNPNHDDPIQGEQSYNDGVTISAELSQLIAKAYGNEKISVKLQAIDMIDVYAADYVDRLYDGKTYDEWWAEYEVYTNRMIEIEGLLKLAPNTELENEYNSCAEKAEALMEYMSQIQKEQKANTVDKELKWLELLEIEAEYKKGYFVFSASADKIKNITKGKCNYFIDVESSSQDSSQEPVEEIH